MKLTILVDPSLVIITICLFKEIHQFNTFYPKITSAWGWSHEITISCLLTLHMLHSNFCYFIVLFYLFIYFSYHSRVFHSYGDFTITVEGLQILTHARHKAIEQWGFFSVPNLQWHGASVYNGHLRGPVTLTPVAERLAVELSLHCTCFYDLGLLQLGFEHPTFRLLGQRSNTLRHHHE